MVKVTIETRAPRSRAGARAGCGEEGCGLLLTRLARAANSSLAAALAETGIRAQQFAILHRLADGGPTSQADLAAALRVHAPNLVRVLDELEGSGLIARRRDATDRRRQAIVLTEAGADLLGKADRVAAETERELLEPLNPAERRVLRDLLARLAAHACSRQGCGPAS